MSSKWTRRGAYSFVKAPLYNGKPMEVGPLARMWVNNKPISPIGQKLFKEYFGLDVKNFRDMGEDLAFSLLGRHVARAEESYLMLDVVERFLKEVRPDEETFSMPVMKDSEGFGFTEAPRRFADAFHQGPQRARSTTIRSCPRPFGTALPATTPVCAALLRKPHRRARARH